MAHVIPVVDLYSSPPDPAFKHLLNMGWNSNPLTPIGQQSSGPDPKGSRLRSDNLAEAEGVDRTQLPYIVANA